MVVFLGLSVGLWKYFNLEKNFSSEFLSPLGKSIGKIVLPSRPEVVGFIPTWMIGKTKTYGDELTQLIFSGIEVNEDGSLVWDVQSRKIYNENYRLLKENIKKTGGKNILSIKLFDDKKMETFLASESARKNLDNEVRLVVEGEGFDGVNIDFEYMSNASRMLDEDFGIWLLQVKNAGWGEVSIDSFANTIIKGDGEKLKQMMEKVDKLIVMAYDFHRPGSDFAGPVAPMKAGVGERSIEEILQKIVEFNLDKKKIIMAYPLYGYEWETNTGEAKSLTRDGGYGRTVFYSEGVGITGVQMDETAQSPWAAWTEKAKKSKLETLKVGKKYKKVTTYYFVDQWHEAYFENEESLRIKIEAAKQAQVGGVGFWALGYEGKSSELIKTLNSK
ncbi:hypothetical protein KBC75_03690 [Candidatus Shapirobacteria bacterium]|nr:hypothetical protein [Candidatus Shapirobacteria bacterium]